MKPKEKALELDEKFSLETRGYLSGHKAALLAVEEILKITHEDPYDRKRTPFDKQYWQEVKRHLQNL